HVDQDRLGVRRGLRPADDGPIAAADGLVGLGAGVRRRRAGSERNGERQQGRDRKGFRAHGTLSFPETVEVALLRTGTFTDLSWPSAPISIVVREAARRRPRL